MRNIKIDFVAVESQAKQLEEIAEGIRRLAERKMTGAIENMAAIWEGESADAYFSKAELVKQELLKTSSSLCDVASNIRAQAKKIYEAERRAIEQTQTTK